MPYDFNRGLKYALGGAAVGFFGSSLVDSIGSPISGAVGDKYKPAVVGGVTVLLVDAVVQQL
jgi:hypothetical protein